MKNRIVGYNYISLIQNFKERRETVSISSQWMWANNIFWALKKKSLSDFYTYNIFIKTYFIYKNYIERSKEVLLYFFKLLFFIFMIISSGLGGMQKCDLY